MPKARYVQLFSLPKKVAELNAEISSNPADFRKEFIRSSCFKGLLYVRSQIIRAEPIVSLISHWNIDGGCFMVNGDRECVISDEDVARIYGLPFGAEKEPIMLDLLDSEYASVASLLGRVDEGLAGERFLNFNVIKGILDRNDLNNEDRAIDYWRFYVLYALHRLLIPCSSSTISTRYLRYLETPEVAERFNWAALVKDKLIDGLNAYKQKLVDGEVPTARPTGDMHCLMHLLFDFMESRILCRRRFTCCLKRVLTVDVVRDLFPPMVVSSLPDVNNGDEVPVREPLDYVKNVDEVAMTGLLLLTEKGENNVVEDDGKRYFMNKKQEIEDEITWCTQRINRYLKRRDDLEAELKELSEKYFSRDLKQATVGVVYGDVEDVPLGNNTTDGNCESSIKNDRDPAAFKEDDVGVKDTNNVEESCIKNQKLSEDEGNCDLMQDDEGKSAEVVGQDVPDQKRDMGVMEGSDTDVGVKDIDRVEERCRKKRKVGVVEGNSDLMQYDEVKVGANGGRDEFCVEGELLRDQQRDMGVMRHSDTDVGVKDIDDVEESCSQKQKVGVDEGNSDLMQDDEVKVGVNGCQDEVCVEGEFVPDHKRDMSVMGGSDTDVGVKDIDHVEEICSKKQEVGVDEGNCDLMEDDEVKVGVYGGQNEVCVEGEFLRDRTRDMGVMRDSDTDVGVRDIDRVEESCSKKQKVGVDEGNSDLMQDDEVKVGVNGGLDEDYVEKELLRDQKRDMHVPGGSDTDVGVKDTDNVEESCFKKQKVAEDERKSGEVVGQDEVCVEGELVPDQKRDMGVMVGSDTDVGVKDIDRVLERCSKKQKVGIDEENYGLLHDDEVKVGIDGSQHEVFVEEKLVADQKRDMDVVASGELDGSVAIGVEQPTSIDTLFPIARVVVHESTHPSNMSVGAADGQVELESKTKDKELMVLVTDAHVDEDIST